MARQRKVLPARRQNGIDDSQLIRSAESLGRMIGSLQRQLDAARRLTKAAPKKKAASRARASKRPAAKTGRRSE